MKKLIGMVLAGAAMAAVAQGVAPGTATPVPATEVPVKKVAVFVQNRTRMPAMDDEIDGIRDRLTASLAAVDGMEVLDSAQIADTFRRYKVTTDEEKKGLVSGIFSGGSVPNVARMMGRDRGGRTTARWRFPEDRRRGHLQEHDSQDRPEGVSAIPGRDEDDD